MGLLKTIEFRHTGIDLEYWRINRITADIDTNFCEVRVGGYLAKADALAGKRAIWSLTFKWSGPQNPITFGMSPTLWKPAIEAKLVEEPAPFAPANPFEGAEIVSDLP